MNERKTHFEVIRQADIPPLLQDSHHGRILSVTYDPSLAMTREMLFTAASFEVSTFLDVAKAIDACKDKGQSFDLVVLGHSIPLAERRALAKEVRTRCAAPVLALVRSGEPRLPEADYFFDSLENPALLLETVVRILRPEARSTESAVLRKDRL